MLIKPKLYLNMSPQTMEDGSLAFARNMKLDNDGILTSDFGYEELTVDWKNKIVGHIVGLDNKIYFFTYGYGTTTSESRIYEYNELTKNSNRIVSGWKYEGGTITGYVSTNITGEKILTIAESNGNKDMPLKHINITYATQNDDESLYTQAPIVPYANLRLTTTYVKTIPNGVYVFFIRYRIRKDVYTPWYLCSHPIFGGTSEKINTLQGGLQYINLHKDSAKSFVFAINDLSNYSGLYDQFQLGFIITHDEATDARIWKSFPINITNNPNTKIYFDYEDVTEANIDDLLKTTYELYNVKNVTSFKNKLYISNYKETDFNPNINLASNIKVTSIEVDGNNYEFRNLKVKSSSLVFNDTLGYYDTIEGVGNIHDNASTLLPTGSFNFNISNLAKINSIEKDQVVSFDTKWVDTNDPDLVIVYNIFNNLYNKSVFGNDYTEPYTIDNPIENKFGIKKADNAGNTYIYKPDTLVGVQLTSSHPWYELDLTFIYGSTIKSDLGLNAARNGVFYFNKYTLYNEPVSIQGHTIAGWGARNQGFDDLAIYAIEDKIKSEIQGKSFFAKCYIEITSGAKSYKLDYADYMDLDNYAGYGLTNDDILSISYANTNVMSETLKNKIQQWTYSVIINNLYGFDESGTPIIRIGTDNITVSSISIVFKKFEFDVTGEEIEVNNNTYNKRWFVNLKTTDYTSLVTFNIKPNLITVEDNGIGFNQKPTLLPLSKYKVYAHFVDNHNIITNGYYVATIETPVTTNISKYLKLAYKVEVEQGETLDTGNYQSFFLSLVNVGNIVMDGFGYTKTKEGMHIINCIEVDSLLYNLNDNITIEVYRNGTFVEKITDAKYYSSSSVSPTVAFGNCGFIGWTTSPGVTYTNCNFYIIIERDKQDTPKQLIKCTPYIKLEETEENEENEGYIALEDNEAFYDSYYCRVKKPSFDLSSSCYVAGNDVYAIDRTVSITLSDFKSYRQLQNSVSFFIRSAFNLNYLSLTEDVPDKIFSVGSASSGIKQVAKVINSATLSYIYELKPMYKDFMMKTFRVKDEKPIQFDNTIRVSSVLSDETSNNSVFTFEPTDYYNIPADRGKIINLFSIGNNIYVHTKSSFYKFDANNTIAASNQDITLKESEPFDSGVSQIFDSQYGYGGINNKEAGCITFDSYIFYDSESKHIFAYSGNGQIATIDGPISKLLDYYKPINCRTIHDERNKRILFEFLNTDNLTISYNYKSKSFISLHDLTLEKTFNTKYKCYSYKDGLRILFESNSIDETPIEEGPGNTIKLFGNSTIPCKFVFGTNENDGYSSPFSVAILMFPKQTSIESINNVSFAGDVLSENSINDKTEDDFTFAVMDFPRKQRVNPVESFYIITDCCVSTIVKGDVDDTIRPDPQDNPPLPNSLLDYKGFKYELGFWNTNYFRNAINDNNIYNYPNQPRANQKPNTDNNSLMYGTYFIFMFDFITKTPIKFESVSFNSKKY